MTLYIYLLTVHLLSWSSARASAVGGHILNLRRSPSSFLAQTTAACLGQYTWMQNSKGQSPCLVAAYVNGACASGTWIVPLLQPGQKYDLPNATTANGCTCSWATYNLLSACTVCQGDAIAPAVQNWDAYRSQCGNFQSTTLYFPANITFPNSSSIPFWASTNPETWQDAHFNVQAAQSIANEGKPDLNPTTNSAQNSKPKSSVSIGALIGGIIGGVAVVAFIITSMCFFCRCRQKGSVTAHSTSTIPSGVKPQSIRSPWGSQRQYYSSSHQRSMSNMSRTTINSEASYRGMHQVVAAAMNNGANTSMSPPPLPHSPPPLPNSPPPVQTSVSPGPMSPALTHSSSFRSILSLIHHRQPSHVEPFTDTQPTGSGLTRKEVEERVGPAVPEQVASSTEDGRPHDASTTITTEPSETTEDDEPRRPMRRLNPPAYTPYPTGAPSFNSPLFGGDGARGVRPEKGGDSDTQETGTNVTPPGSGSGAALMSQLGIVQRPGPAVQLPSSNRHPPSYGNNREPAAPAENEGGLRLVTRQSLETLRTTSD